MKRKFNFSLQKRIAEIILICLVFFSGIMLGFSSGSFFLNVNKVGFCVVSTLQQGVYGVCNSVVSVFLSVKNLANLKKEYDLLSEKLKDYEYMQRSNTEIRKENERLKEQLGFAQDFQYRNIFAQIIGRDPDVLFSGITINRGARHGVKKGQPVLAIQNGNVGVVGKIVTVGITTSLVMPVYDRKCNISARLQNIRDIGIVTGNGVSEAPLSLQYIRKRLADEIALGDVIVTSGENGNFMKDIPVGRVKKVSVLDYDSSLSIDVDPIIDFTRLESVLIVDQFMTNDKKTVIDDGDKK